MTNLFVGPINIDYTTMLRNHLEHQNNIPADPADYDNEVVIDVIAPAPPEAEEDGPDFVTCFGVTIYAIFSLTIVGS